MIGNHLLFHPECREGGCVKAKKAYPFAISSADPLKDFFIKVNNVKNLIISVCAYRSLSFGMTDYNRDYASRVLHTFLQ